MTIKKRTPNPTFWPLVTPDMPRGNFFANAFLQSSSIGLLPVTVSRLYPKKPKRSRVTIKKKDPKSYFLTSSDPRHAPGQNFLHHCFLLFITFDLKVHATWLCLFKMDFASFGATFPLALRPGVYIKIPNVFLQSSSIGLLPVTVSRF